MGEEGRGREGRGRRGEERGGEERGEITLSSIGLVFKCLQQPGARQEPRIPSGSLI